MSDNSDAKAKPDRAKALCHLIVLVTGPSGDAPVAWLRASAKGWRLPSIAVTNTSGFSNTAEPIRQELAAELAVDAQVLSHVYDFWPPDGGQEVMVAVVEAARDTIPPDWQPFNLEEVRSASFAISEHRDLLDRWLCPAAPGAMSPERVAWAMPGWRPRAEAWINEQLGRIGVRLAGPITTRKIWPISCVLRLPTSAGNFYFKAVPPLFGREPALTDALARRHPGQGPEVVALDAWHEALMNAYLESWRDITSEDKIEAALRLARPLGALQMAVSYYDIRHAGEPLVRWQLDGGGPYFLRQVLKYRDHVPDP